MSEKDFQPEEPKIQMTIYLNESQAKFIEDNFKDKRQKSKFMRFLVGNWIKKQEKK